MIVFINGEFVPEEEAHVSVFDRGFLYGDGLFETIRVSNGLPFRWLQHWTRLQSGAEYLKLRLPISESCLREFAVELVEANGMPDSMLRITLSRGVGLRGYSPKGASKPTLVMSIHAVPMMEPQTMPGWKLCRSSVRLAADEPLAQFKTCNKLVQIVARAEADTAGADEALLLNTAGWVVEGASSNLFWIQNDRVCTPPLGSGVLRGVTRAVLLEICERMSVTTCETQITPRDLFEAQGVFLSVSSVGVAQAVSLDNHPLSLSPLTKSLYQEYVKLVAHETH